MDPNQKAFEFEFPSINVSDDDNSDEMKMFSDDEDATGPDPDDHQIFESDNEDATEILEDSTNVTPKKADDHYDHHNSGIELEDVNRSPGGSINVIPNVADGIQPVVGTLFETLGKAIEMYRKYAEIAGFDIRRSTQSTNNVGVVKLKYVVCHRQGVPKKRSVDSIEIDHSRKELRRTNFKVTNCKASVRFQLVEGTSFYKLYYFHPNHNHKLFDERDKNLMRSKRKIQFSDKMMVHRAARAKIGATKAHHLQVCLKGGYDEVGATTTEYKNFKRDLDSFVGNKDVQMVVNMFNDRKLHGSNFDYEFKAENGKLQGLFWADELSRFNYAEFGDIISFDATYRSNRHSMVFLPFTGIDNHRKSIVLGSGLLDGENKDMYKWVLEAFLKVHGRQPRMVLTDQDAAIKEALPVVFPDAKHRLCMWHIINKLPTKVITASLKKTDFKKRFNKIVWDGYLDPKDFEDKWLALMDEFNLLGHGWLKDIFAMRSSWIPAYFKEVPLCGLMKTTSRSESMNSFFQSFSHYGDNILFFILSYDTAMDKQRNRQRTQDHNTDMSTPNFKTERRIERHAASVYTRTVFLHVQKEIFKGDRFCTQWNVSYEDGCQIYTIRQKDKSFMTKGEFKVVQSQTDGSLLCSCQHFQYHGILCRHIFHVLFNIDAQEIPQRYILRRWMRGVIPMDILRTRRIEAGRNDRVDILHKDVHYEIDQIFNRLRGDEVKLSQLLDKVRNLKIEVAPEDPVDDVGYNKDDEFESILGVSRPETVEILPPQGIRNKGCGTGKRLIGAGEKAIKKNARSKRLCKGCGELALHDIRNCPLKKNSSK